MTQVRGLRGATTADTNTKEAIVSATRELLEALIETNEFHVDDVVSAFFTTTTDLNAEFPAVAARLMGWQYAALMCGHEMMVPDATPLCIRVLIHLNTDKKPQDLKFQYLRGARHLRSRGTDQAKI